MPSLSLFNPWVLLGALVAAVGIFFAGDRHGLSAGHLEIQAKWDAAEKQRAWESQRNVERVREAEGGLQDRANQERKANESLVASLNARVEQLTGELRKRPSRPAQPATSGAQAPGSGAEGSTGLGLYREDGLFLVGEAATGKRIQLQRDACYRAYEAAQAELARLGASLAPSAP